MDSTGNVDDFEKLRSLIWKKLGKIKPANNETKASKNFLFDAINAASSESLPPYYLMYFLFVDLLKFKNLGQWEKVSWSIPIDFEGVAYLIEHRKFGVGLFASDPLNQKTQIKEIVSSINKAVKAAQPFFAQLASQAMKDSKLNVVNHHRSLFKRFEYFHESYRKIKKEAVRRKDEKIVKTSENKWGTSTIISFPYYQLKMEADWLALATIEAFFSWTEHIFIHLSILNGAAVTGESVALLAKSDWQEKYKSALPVKDAASKEFLDKLLPIRRQLRNFIAHGAFGKQGEAFFFHSGTGAVPMLLDDKVGTAHFSLGNGIDFVEDEAIGIIDSFMKYLSKGPSKTAYRYIKSGLPLILPMAQDGSYLSAAKSMKSMDALIGNLGERFDRAANMDW